MHCVFCIVYCTRLRERGQQERDHRRDVPLQQLRPPVSVWGLGFFVLFADLFCLVCGFFFEFWLVLFADVFCLVCGLAFFLVFGVQAVRVRFMGDECREEERDHRCDFARLGECWAFGIGVWGIGGKAPATN